MLQVGERLAILANAIQSLTTTVQETRDLLGALGAVQGLEWSQDVKQWVSKSKLNVLRACPLDSSSA